MDYQPPGLIDCGSGGADGKITWTIDYYGTAAPSMDQAYTLTITQQVDLDLFRLNTPKAAPLHRQSNSGQLEELLLVVQLLLWKK